MCTESSNRQYVDIGRRRGYLLDRAKPIELNERRHNYARQFLKTLGYDETGLPLRELLWLFKLLARTEEMDTLWKLRDQNWEIDFASIERQQEKWLPVIDLRVRQWLKNGWVKPAEDIIPLWPDGKRFALCLTHDVDGVHCNKFMERLRSFSSYRSAPMDKKLTFTLSIMKHGLRKAQFWVPSPDPPFEIWLDVEAKYGFRSSFFFLPCPPWTPSWRDDDAFYHYSDRVSFDGHRITVAEVMRILVDRGWDVGLHGSFASQYSLPALNYERKLLEKVVRHKVVTIRNHHLRYDVRFTPLVQARAGFQADSSLGSNNSAGFRCGTGMPFFQYDFISDEALDIIQVPLIIQDVAILGEKGMGKDIAIKHSLEIMHSIAEIGGAMTILWHNEYFKDDIEFEVYEAILAEANRLNAWGCSLLDLNTWWRKRCSQLGIVPNS